MGLWGEGRAGDRRAGWRGLVRMRDGRVGMANGAGESGCAGGENGVWLRWGWGGWGRLISGVVWGFLMGARCPGRRAIGWSGLGTQPTLGLGICWGWTQGRPSCLRPTLGFGTQSRWDWGRRGGVCRMGKRGMRGVVGWSGGNRADRAYRTDRTDRTDGACRENGRDGRDGRD